MERIDRTLEETRKLIRNAMRRLARREARKTKYNLHTLKESQRRTDAIFARFLSKRTQN